MALQSRSERIPTQDGAEYRGHLVLPESGRGPGLVVCQEIFGITNYIKARCEELAELGYVALAPDLYWRLEPGVDLEEMEEGALQKAFGYRQRVDVDQAVGDAAAALKHLRSLPETAGRAGVLGFCFGGGIAFRVAAEDDPDVAVSYYGSDVPGAIGMAGEVHCPILFQFGGADEYLTPEKQQAIRDAFEGEPRAEFHVHEGAGHAFDNRNAPIFSHPQASAAAWKQTAEWLLRNYPPQV